MLNKSQKAEAEQLVQEIENWRSRLEGCGITVPHYRVVTFNFAKCIANLFRSEKSDDTLDWEILTARDVKILQERVKAYRRVMKLSAAKLREESSTTGLEEEAMTMLFVLKLDSDVETCRELAKAIKNSRRKKIESDLKASCEQCICSFAADLAVRKAKITRRIRHRLFR